MTLNALSDVRDGSRVLQRLKMWVCVCLRERAHPPTRRIQATGLILEEVVGALGMLVAMAPGDGHYNVCTCKCVYLEAKLFSFFH